MNRQSVCFLLSTAGVALTPLSSPAPLVYTPGEGWTYESAAAETNVVRRVSVDEFEKLTQAKTNVVLDVRTQGEFDAGHIAGATNLDFRSPDFEKELAKLDKSKVYLVHCAAGGRSAQACKKMQQAGFQSLVDLPAGFRGWEKAGKPVEKK
jgi:rhodanese-related sulfurtransferase